MPQGRWTSTPTPLWRAAAIALALAVVFASAGAPAEASQRRSAYAITGATVITSPGNSIANGTVVLRGGLIEAVGAGLAAPPDARVIDGTGMTVYAGWIDAFSDVAIAEEEGDAPTPGGRGGGRGGRGGGQQALQMLELGAPGVNDNVRPEFVQADYLSGEDGDMTALRDAGFTAALVAPQQGIYRGQSVLVALRETSPEEMVLADDVAQVVGFSSGGFGRGYPSSAMGVIALIRQVLLDTQRQATWQNSFDNDPAGMPRPEANPAYTALMAALAGDQQVIFDAGNTREAKRGIGIAQEFGLRAVIKGNGNEYDMVDVLAGAGVGLIVPVDYPDPPTVGDDGDANLDVDLSDLLRWEAAPGNAAALEGTGVAFAFTSDGVAAGDFAANVRKAIEAGLSEEGALAALTTTPASMFGVSSIVGTIEPGKIANVVVATGAPFAEGTEVRHVFVDGVHTAVEASPASGRGGRGGGGMGGGPIDPRGTWSVTMGSGDMSQTMEWVIAGQAGALSGSAQTPGGEIDFDRVGLDGNQLTVSMVGPQGPLAVTVTVNGDRLSGRISMEGFTIDIDGRRSSGPGNASQLRTNVADGGER